MTDETTVESSCRRDDDKNHGTDGFDPQRKRKIVTRGHDWVEKKVLRLLASDYMIENEEEEDANAVTQMRIALNRYAV